MKKALRKAGKTALTTIIVLLFITGFTLCGLGIAGLNVRNLNYAELKNIKSFSELQDWFYGEIGEIAVGEAVVVESVSYDRYAYQQLDDITKTVYDQIYSCMINMDEKVSLSSNDVDVLTKAYNAVMADYGDIFWVKGYQYNTYKSGEKVVGLEFAPKYTMAADQRQLYEETIESTVATWLSGISEDASDYEKAKYVFEALISRVDYSVDSFENQNILSVFINRATVCQGYADAAWYMLDKLGVKSTIVTGSANNEAHAWNLVYLDGAYYFMDVTWGNSKYLNAESSTEKRINYAYMAMTTEELSQTHIIDMDIDIPECLSNADNYYVHEGLYFDTFDANSIGWTLQKSYDAKEDEVSIKLANAELFKQVSDYFFENRHIGDYCRGISSIYYIMDDDTNVITIQW